MLLNVSIIPFAIKHFIKRQVSKSMLQSNPLKVKKLRYCMAVIDSSSRVSREKQDFYMVTLYRGELPLYRIASS